MLSECKYLNKISIRVNFRKKINYVFSVYETLKLYNITNTEIKWVVNSHLNSFSFRDNMIDIIDTSRVLRITKLYFITWC